MNRASEAVAALLCIFVGLAGFFAVSAIAYGIADNMPSGPSPKSDQELCKERGGVYVVLRSGPNRCFAKDAFK